MTTSHSPDVSNQRPMQVWVVLPAFNEEENIGELLQSISTVQQHLYNCTIRIVVVDDCSSDNTARVARSTPIDIELELVSHEKNSGLAATILTGLHHVLQTANDDDIIVTMDADSSHRPGQLIRMVREILEGIDIVIASRFQPGAVVRGVPAHRQLLSWGMSILFRACNRVPGVRDYSCGFRAYRCAALQAFIPKLDPALFAEFGFACMVALLLELHQHGFVFREIPIVLRYDSKRGHSKLNIFHTISRTLPLAFGMKVVPYQTQKQ